jgi:hypothetical protein
MATKSAVIFVMLVLCGTICILASLTTISLLYHLHATRLAMPVEYPALPNEIAFGIFVALPSALAFLAGVVLLVIGIRSGRAD